jgi:hypothetical protein
MSLTTVHIILELGTWDWDALNILLWPHLRKVFKGVAVARLFANLGF